MKFISTSLERNSMNLPEVRGNFRYVSLEKWLHLCKYIDESEKEFIQILCEDEKFKVL